MLLSYYPLGGSTSSVIQPSTLWTHMEAVRGKHCMALQPQWWRSHQYLVQWSAWNMDLFFCFFTLTVQMCRRTLWFSWQHKWSSWGKLISDHVSIPCLLPIAVQQELSGVFYYWTSSTRSTLLSAPVCIEVSVQSWRVTRVIMKMSVFTCSEYQMSGCYHVRHECHEVKTIQKS